MLLDITTNEKDLGVHVDSNLTFEHHIEEVVNKTNRMFGMIRRSYTCLDGPTMTKLYTSLISLLLGYSNVAWTHVTSTELFVGHFLGALLLTEVEFFNDCCHNKN